MATETPHERERGFGRDDGSLRSRLSRFANDHVLAITMGPALLVIFVIFVYPVAFLFYQSVFLTLPGIDPRFVAFRNYTTMFQSAEFWSYFQHTLVYSTGSLIVSTTSGLAIALGINHVRRRWLRNVYSTVLMFAWAIPIAVVALIWRWILQGNEFGLLNLILVSSGLVADPVAWLANGDRAMLLVMLVDAWARMPFAMVVFLAGLQSIPNHLYDATRVDGATTLQAFRAVTLPRLRPYFAIVGLITWMFAFRAFAIIFPMTRGGPGQRTTVLSIHIYRTGMVNFNFGYAAAVAVFLVGVTVLVALFYVTQIIGGIDE
ncbi:carbohydrate ABC transporter permease [Salinigranum salinum]|uniref:carbohydrate ABC transporter permease n=1 Tax=Salinigranum salinum TaxID=1364937 RepID=UPI00195DD625|nr:sugar ABC transporter permease [Salinigranum salinum]